MAVPGKLWRICFSNAFTTEHMTPEEQASFRLLRALQQHPEYSQRELAQAVGLSLGRTNYVLRALIEKGWVKIDRFMQSTEKVNKTAYILTPAGLHHRLMLTRNYINRKKQEYAALESELAALLAEEGEGARSKPVTGFGGPTQQ